MTQDTMAQSALQTLVDATLAGGAAYLAAVKNETQTFLSGTITYVSDEVSGVEAMFAELSVEEAPLVSSTFPNAAALSSFLKASGIGLGLIYAATQIANSSDPTAESLKQASLFGTSLAISEGIAEGLVFAGASTVFAAAAGAVVAGIAIYAIDQNWDSIVNSVSTYEGEGYTAAAAATQAASDWLASVSAWLDQTGSDALSTLENAVAGQNTANVIEALAGVGLANAPFIALTGAADAASPEFGSGLAATAAAIQLNNAQTQISPLVLDLTGDGLNLTALSPTSPYFDLTGDGFGNKTGWIGSGTGLLVLPNSNGSVTSISNLFGNQNGDLNGFQALSAYDSNNDGVINSSDTIFTQLRVMDSSGNLYTLADLGITSINLTPTAVDENIAGNTVKYTSTFTMNGNNYTIGDAWFSYSPTFTQEDTAPTISPTIAALPQLHGYGIVADLQSSMANDSTLESDVADFVGLSSTTAPTTIASDVQTIMYEWGNSTDASGGYGGSGISAQQAIFLENYTGDSFTYVAGAGPHQAVDIAQAWSDVFDDNEARLVLQSPMAAEVPEFTYNASLDMVLPADTLSTSFADAYTRLGTVTSSNLSSWELEDQVANAFQMDANISQSDYEQAIAAGSNDTIASVANAVANGIGISFASGGGIIETGTVDGSTFYAGPGVSEIITEGAYNAHEVNGVEDWTLSQDIINYNAGDGTLEINGQGNAADTNNTLVLGPGITASDLTFTQGSGNNVVVTDGTSGDQITLDNMLTTNYDNGLDTIDLANGSTLTNYQIASDVLATGSSTHTSLTDELGNATFDSKGYAHYENAGLTGNNTFVYDTGYGALEISDQNETGTPSVLDFGTGIASSSINVSSNSSGDLLITDGTSGDQIQLDGMTNNSEDGVGQANFTGGSDLTAAQLINMATTGSSTNTNIYVGLGDVTFNPDGYAHYIDANLSGGNTFDYNEGNGDVEISDHNETSSGNVLAFGTGITSSSISVSSDSSGDLLITDGTSGDQVRIDGMLNSSDNGVSADFTGGSSLTAAQLITDATTGSASNTSLYDDLGNATFNPEGHATYVNGDLSGGNTIVYDEGYGHVEISDDNETSSNNILEFGSGITESNVTLSTDGDGNLFLTDGVTGDQVKVDGVLSNADEGVQEIEFSDGTTWNQTDVEDRLAAEGNNVINSGGTVHSESGSSSINNTYIYDTGYGALAITQYSTLSTPDNVLQFGSGITPSNVTVSDDAYGDFLLKDGTSGDTVTLNYMLEDPKYGVEQVEFANGTVWTLSQLQSMATTGSATNTSLYDELGNATFDPAGHATSIKSTGSNDNTYIYNAGYGSVAITSEYSSSPDNTLQFGSSITPSNVTVSDDAYGDLLLKDGTTGDVVTLNDMLEATGYGVQNVDFSGGTDWTLSQLLTKATTGSSTNTSLYDELGGATFDPAGHASSIKSVGSNNNTFIYDSGYGSVAIDSEYSSSPNNTLEFGTGISPSQIEITKDSSGDELMTDGTSGDTVTLDYMYGSSIYGVQKVEFAGGSSWNSTYLSSLKLGTSGNDTINGTTGNDTFYSSPGTDTMNGDGGYDSYEIGTNVGTTTINNSISGGSAADGEVDFLAGLNDENLWFKESGNNLIVDLLGTSKQITLSGWFGSNPSSEVEKFTANGLTLDTQVSSLVSAMATYAAANPSFNPATASSMPTDTTLRSAIASAWHT